MVFEIRQAGPANAETVAAMIGGLIEELSPGTPADLGALAVTSRAVLEMTTVTALAAFDGPNPAGLMMLNDCAAIYAGGVFGEITELYVRPDLRSRGVAAALLRAAERIGMERGWRRIEVGAPDQPRWARTVAFYCREGFTEVGPRLRKAL